ncbi:MAG: PstS family phosphate ABC transporter substrate-binding protein [Bdellovibrionales bacterium]
MNVLFNLMILCLLSIPSLADQKLVISGSSTLLDLSRELKPTFEKVSGKQIVLTGSGSTEGYEDLLSGKASIARMSRPLYSEELRSAKNKDILLKPFQIGLDSICIIANKKSIPKSSSKIDKQELVSLYFSKEGKVKNLLSSHHTGALTIFSGPKESGTVAFFKNHLGKKNDEFSPTVKTVKTSKMVLEAVGKQQNSLGFVSLADLRTKPDLERNITVLNYGNKKEFASNCNSKNSADRTYDFTRQLYFVLKIPLQKAESKIIQFLLSEDGQKVIKDKNLIPVGALN